MAGVRFEIARPLTHPHLAKGIDAGSAEECPFCKARGETKFPIGSHVVLMNGCKAGISGTTIDGRPQVYGDKIAVRLDEEFCHGPGFHVFNLQVDLLCVDTNLSTPQWLSPLSTDDLVYVDEAVLRSLGDIDCFNSSNLRPESLFPIIGAIWNRRLPVRGDDLAETLIMHGFPAGQRRRLVNSINFGLDLLVWSHGRSPIKRRRMPPMSQPYYEKSRRNADLRRLIARLRGRDP